EIARLEVCELGAGGEAVPHDAGGERGAVAAAAVLARCRDVEDAGRSVDGETDCGRDDIAVDAADVDRGAVQPDEERRKQVEELLRRLERRSEHPVRRLELVAAEQADLERGRRGL